MPASTGPASRALLPGDWVEVLSAPEIAAQLDARGTLDGLPLMPEMLPACGRRYRVAMRAERTCVHPPQGSHRRLRDAVVLEGLRCDGGAHGGCQLGCMMLWKESWLRRVEGPSEATGGVAPPAPLARALVDRDGERYVCQATELPRATAPGEPLWRPGQYLRMLRVGTFSLPELATALAGPGLRWLRRKLLGRPRNVAAPPTPGALGLAPGQWVEVMSRAEIQSTLDGQGRHRGLPFSGEMYAYCGRKMRVSRRVERIVDESTGRLRVIADTVMLDGSLCERYFGCARGMPIMWREAWLRPIDAPADVHAPRSASSSCHRA